MEERSIELFEVNNAIRVVFNIKSSEFSGRKHIELESPIYHFKPTNDQWRIKFSSVFDGVHGLETPERYDYYSYCRQKLIPGISLHIDAQNRIGNTSHVYVYQVIASVYSCPEFGVIGFQSRHHSQSYINYPRMFSLNQLQHAGKDSGVVRLCFEVSCYDGERQHNLAGPSSNIPTVDQNVKLLNLFSFLEEGIHSDVTLRAGNKEFKAHKLILAARSPVFAAMFQSNMQETHTGLIEVGFSAEIVEEMLRFMYTNKVNNLSLLSRELFAAAHMYELDTLQNMCKNNICANINVDNVTAVLEFAERYTLNQVASSAMDFVSMYEPEVVKKREYIDFLVERLRPDNVAGCLEMARRNMLNDFYELIIKFIAKNFAVVMKDREYRELYRTNVNLILEIDEKLTRYMVSSSQ